jgi:hypothetical protein
MMDVMTMASGKSSSKTPYGLNPSVRKYLNDCRASNMNVDITRLSFVIDVAEASWEGCCKNFDVAMYHTSEAHALRPYGKLNRRQEDSNDATPTSSTNLPTYSFPEPTATSADSVNTLDLNHSTDPGQSLIPFSNSTLLSCTNCSTFGTLDFSFLSFSLQNLTDIPDLLAESGIELGDVFQGGELEIIANGMGARVELLTNVTGEHVLEVPLFAIPLLYRILVSVPLADTQSRLSICDRFPS